MKNNRWETYAPAMYRLKVEGGYIYSNLAENATSCFVPDVDLTRYQSHLRDAYNQGYADGRGEKECEPGVVSATAPQEEN